MNGELVFVSLYYVLLPALFVDIDSTFGATINTHLGFSATDGAFHDLLPPLSFFPLSWRESVI